MGRIIITVVLILLAFLVIRRLLRGPARRDAAKAPREAAFERTVRCEHCGVHVAQRLALERQGRYYCSREHLPKA